MDTFFNHVHTSEACDIEGASTSIFSRFAFPTNWTYGMSLWNRIPLSLGSHLKQNPASSSDVLQFHGPHHWRLEKCDNSQVLLQNNGHIRQIFYFVQVWTRNAAPSKVWRSRCKTSHNIAWRGCFVRDVEIMNKSPVPWSCFPLGSRLAAFWLTKNVG